MTGKLSFIMVVVRDMEASKRFYRDALGLKLVSESAEWTQLDAGNIRVGLHKESDKLKVEPHEGIQFAFEVADVQKAAGELKGKGVHHPRAAEAGLRLARHLQGPRRAPHPIVPTGRVDLVASR